jgi:hypothetical protein
MKTVYLHMGYHKTGTTSFQTSCVLQQNRDELAAQGFHYPIFQDYGRMETHAFHSIPLFSLFAVNPEKYVWNLGRTDLDAFRQSIESQFSETLKQHDKVIISSEDLSVLKKEGLQNLRDFLLRYVDAIVPLAVIRSPYAFFCSNLNEWIRFGYQKIRFPSKILRTLNLREVFPETILISYNEAKKSGKGLVKHLMEAMEINTSNIEEVRGNNSTNNKLSRLQYMFNLSNPGIKDGVFNPDFIQLHTCEESEWCEEVKQMQADAEPFRLTSEEYACLEPVIDHENDFFKASLGEEFCDNGIEFSAPLDVEEDLKDYPLLKDMLIQHIDPVDIDPKNLFNFEPMVLPPDFSLDGYKQYNPDVVAVFDNDHFITSHYLLNGREEGRKYGSSDI